MGNGPQDSPGAQIALLLRREVLEAGVARAASAGYQRPGAGPELGAVGTLPGGRAVDSSTLFDLASVSKPVVACAAARLAARGRLTLDTPLGRLLPEARGSASEDVPLELLLAHRAGLDTHRPLFAPVLAGRPFRRAEALAIAAGARRPDCRGSAPRDGFPPLYSDLGFALVGAALEAVTGEPLDHVVHEEVAAPLELELGSARMLRRRRRSFALDVAPTEIVRARGGCLRGVVHDENAWALSGHGAAGHAGLFGTARAVLGFGVALLDALAGRSDWLEQGAFAPLVRRRAGGTLRAGFDGKSDSGSSAGALAGPDTFGHLGFTGTSLWCDPGAGTACALLTNRVYPTRDNPRIRAARPAVHDALFRAARAVLPGPPDP